MLDKALSPRSRAGCLQVGAGCVLGRALWNAQPLPGMCAWNVCLGCVGTPSRSFSARVKPLFVSLCDMSSQALLCKSFNVVSRKDVHRQLIMIINELSKPTLGFRVIITSQQKWPRKEKYKANDGLAL